MRAGLCLRTAFALLLPACASAERFEALRKDLGVAAQTLGRDAGIRGGRCQRPVYVEAIDAARRRAQDLAPLDAAKTLTDLQNSSDVAKHLGVSLFMAVRSQGYDLAGGVYCDVPKGGGALPDRWIAASTRQGPVFILDLAAGVKETGHGLKRLFALHAERGGAAAAGPFLAASAEELFSCGPWQPHPFGIAGKLFEALGREAFQPCEETERCARSRQSPATVPGVAIVSGEYDAAFGWRLADLARQTVAGKPYGTGWCYRWALITLERAGLIDEERDYEWNGGPIPYNPAYRFAEWADADPAALRRQLGLRRIPTPAGYGAVPVGSLVVYPRSVCGFSPTAGHIEFIVGGGMACSDHCRELPASGCLDVPEWRAAVGVYMPVGPEGVRTR